MNVLDARWSITVVGTFESSHILEDSWRCFRDHGHRWTAEVTVSSSEMEKEGIPRGAEDLEQVWMGLVAELDYRRLDKMLPGVITTPLGLANWFFAGRVGTWT